MDDILSNPIKFFEYVKGDKPFSYQKKILNCKSKRIAIRSGRQIGKTTCMAALVLYRAFTYPSQIILIIAPKRGQSKILFQMIQDFVNNKEFIKKSILRETTTEMFFDNGSRMYCLSGAIQSSDKTRGHSPNLMIIDEAAFVPNETYDALKPSVIASKGDIILISTPYGKRGFFYNAFLPKSEYTPFCIKCSQCPNISAIDLQKERNRPGMTKNKFKQEYEAEFIGESDVFFPLNYIKKIIADIPQIDGPEPGRRYWLGVDTARMGEDETAYIIRDDNGHLKKILTDEKKPSTTVIGRIKHLNDVFRFECINIDSAGTGGAVCDVLIEEGYPVVGKKFSIVGKEILYRNFKSLMEHDMIKIPNDEKLIYQMSNLIETYTMVGSSIQPLEKTMHDDLIDSAVLAFADMSPIEETSNDYYARFI